MDVLAAGNGTAITNVILGAAGTIITGIAIWVGRGIHTFVQDLREVLADYKPVEPRVEHGVTIDKGRPGMPGQIAELRQGVHELSETVAHAAAALELLRSVPQQLEDNRRFIEERLDQAAQKLEAARVLAAQAASTASQTDQRTSELAELVGGQLEALHQENQGLRAALHELGIDTEITKPGD